MARFDFDIGVLGGGAAGLTVASGAAQLGARTLLVEKEPELGGDCLHYGCVPSKTLIKTAHVRHLMNNSQQFGLPEVQVPPVDFSSVAQRIKDVIARIQEHDSVERFCGLGVRVEFGEPEFTDEHTVRLGGESFNAKNWVIATGSSPGVPPVEGLSDTPFITNKEVFTLSELPASMIILGAGPIAVEMAQAFCRLGTKVQVVQRGAQILSKEDADLADLAMGVLKDEGVVFHLSSKVLRVSDLGSEREVVIQSGGREVSLRAERLLVAMGRTPNIDTLGLDAAGVRFVSRGVGVDARLRTSQPHIYAAGDVTGAYQFTHAAGYEGGIVVSNAIFHLPRKTDYTFMPWCTYTDPELASIGMNEKRATEAGLKYKVYAEEFKTNDRSLAEGEHVGRIKMLLDEKDKPLGVQIFGPRAGELLSEWVAVLGGGVKLSALAGAVHPYPTLGEINKKVVGSFFSEKIFSDKVKRGLKFFFNLKGRACP